MSCLALQQVFGGGEKLRASYVNNTRIKWHTCRYAAKVDGRWAAAYVLAAMACALGPITKIQSTKPRVQTAPTEGTS